MTTYIHLVLIGDRQDLPEVEAHPNGFVHINFGAEVCIAIPPGYAVHLAEQLLGEPCAERVAPRLELLLEQSTARLNARAEQAPPPVGSRGPAEEPR
jgi:hypothetical protein